jgi:hypothetical protein
LTKEDLAAIETGLNASDDPRKYYDASYVENLVKTVLAKRKDELEIPLDESETN